MLMLAKRKPVGRRVVARRAPVVLPRMPRPLTAREFFAATPPDSRYTLIEGDCFMPPMPIPYHQRVVLNIYDSLRDRVKTCGIEGELFGVPVDITVDNHNVYQPDLCYFSPERAKGVRREKITTVPEFVIEVLSSSTAKYDMGPKRLHYGRNGVQELWIADPRKETVAIYRFAEKADAPVTVLARKNDVAAATVVPGGRISLADVFAE
jgi:Uma2 family endonuclease